MMQQIKVTDVMRDCQAAIVPSSITIRHAAERLMVSDSAVLIAIDEEGRLAGQVAESDIVRQLLLSEVTSETIEPILTCYVESVFATATVGSVLHLFRSSCHEALPVLAQDRKVVGILSRHDIVRLLLSEHSAVDGSHIHTTMKPHLGKASNTASQQNRTTYGSQSSADED